MIHANEVDQPMVQDDVAEPIIREPSFQTRSEMRKTRLFILGALTEQIASWLFQDIIPLKSKRSIDIPGNFAFL